MHFAQAVFVRIGCDQGCAAFIKVAWDVEGDVHVTACIPHLKTGLHGSADYVERCILEVAGLRCSLLFGSQSLRVSQMLGKYGAVKSFDLVPEPSALLLEHSKSGVPVQRMQQDKGDQHRWMAAAGSW